jgi:hypothetical protein
LQRDSGGGQHCRPIRGAHGALQLGGNHGPGFVAIPAMQVCAV